MIVIVFEQYPYHDMISVRDTNTEFDDTAEFVTHI